MALDADDKEPLSIEGGEWKSVGRHGPLCSFCESHVQVDPHVQSNPSVDRVEFVSGRCACGAFSGRSDRPRRRMLFVYYPARRSQIATTSSTERWPFRPVESLELSPRLGA